jgi:hypothetical protein
MGIGSKNAIAYDSAPVWTRGSRFQTVWKNHVFRNLLRRVCDHPRRRMWEPAIMAGAVMKVAPFLHPSCMEDVSPRRPRPSQLAWNRSPRKIKKEKRRGA